MYILCLYFWLQVALSLAPARYFSFLMLFCSPTGCYNVVFLYSQYSTVSTNVKIDLKDSF